MQTNKSDLKRFCETVWIMTKSNVIPWIVCAGLIGLMAYGVHNAAGMKKNLFPTKTERQR